MNDTLLKMVVEAIQNTPKEYYEVGGTVIYERIFCYEFYHQFRKLQENPKYCDAMISGLSDVLLSGEPGKCTGNILDKIREIWDNKETSKDDIEHEKFPDFVLHGGLDNTDEQKQLMVIEVKRSSMINAKALYDDIDKLVQIIGNLKFQIGLFIAVGMSSEKLKEKLKKHKGLLESCFCKENLYFIATEDIPKPKSNSCSSPAKDVPQKTDFSKYYFSAAKFLGESLNCGSKD